METIGTNWEILTRLLVAMILGLILGMERTMAHKTAGMRTYSLVSMGAALLVVVSEIISLKYTGTNIDPMRMASQIVVGVGFLGAGLIILRESKVEGLTTAAGLWISAGIGIAAGFGLYTIAVFTALITLFVFTILWFVEKRIQKIIDKRKNLSEHL